MQKNRKSTRKKGDEVSLPTRFTPLIGLAEAARSAIAQFSTQVLTSSPAITQL